MQARRQKPPGRQMLSGHLDALSAVPLGLVALTHHVVVLRDQADGLLTERIDFESLLEGRDGFWMTALVHQRRASKEVSDGEMGCERDGLVSVFQRLIESP